MKVFIGADHAGFVLKESLKTFLSEHGYDVEDMGAHAMDTMDDYPDFVFPVAKKVSETSESRGIVIGGSGQGEAMAANRLKGIRAVVYYGSAPHTQTDASGKELDILTSTREHNNANILALGARFLSEKEAHESVKKWLNTGFSGDERHLRRINKIDA